MTKITRTEPPGLWEKLNRGKFSQATRHINGDSPDEWRDLILALDHAFGDSSWIDGALGVIVRTALSTIMDAPDETKP